jgi:hypothetical protein
LWVSRHNFFHPAGPTSSKGLAAALKIISEEIDGDASRAAVGVALVPRSKFGEKERGSFRLRCDPCPRRVSARRFDFAFSRRAISMMSFCP